MNTDKDNTISDSSEKKDVSQKEESDISKFSKLSHQFFHIRIPKILSIREEQENFDNILSNVKNSALFRGTNLYVLFFAILIACLGLNLNSAAVIIGAMLISPLIGPIVGAGLGLSINDLGLIRASFKSYFYSTITGLVASTIYFLISPINEAHSEILARTLPTVYDVLIALFGGFAGILAISSTRKGNVIPGVAIATALMPPLCTAGFGLATWQLTYFVGALYLYLINSVFIMTATLITAQFLKFPHVMYQDPRKEKREKRLITTIVIATLLPSIYLAYDLVKQNKFERKAHAFIDTEAHFPNDYLLRKDVNMKSNTILLTFGGKEIEEEDIQKLRNKLKYYGLEGTDLQIKYGFSFLEEKKLDEAVPNQQLTTLGKALEQAELERKKVQTKLDSVSEQQKFGRKIYSELKLLYPQIEEAIIQPALLNNDTLKDGMPVYLVSLKVKKGLKSDTQKQITDWLKMRTGNKNVKLILE